MTGLVSNRRQQPTASETCEVLVRGVWTPLAIDQVLGLRAERLKRCPECLGKLRALPAPTGHRQGWFEHELPHKGCSRDASFEGRSRRHPRALF